MTVAEDAPGAARPLARAWNLFRRPRVEWDAIAAEPATTAGVAGWLIGVVAIQALSPAVAALVIGHAPATVFTGLVLNFVMALIAAWLIGAAISILAPLFGGAKSQTRSLQALAYSATVLAVVAIYELGPRIWIISQSTTGAPNAFVRKLGAVQIPAMLLVIYGAVLLWMGLWRLMQIPPKARIAFFVTVILAAILIEPS